MKTACGSKRHSSCWYFYRVYEAQIAGCASQKHSVDHCHCLRRNGRFMYHQTLRNYNTDINPQDTRKYERNIFRNLVQLGSLFQCHFTWNSTWTFNKEINVITQGLRKVFVIFNAANTNRGVRYKICTFHFSHMNLKSKPRTWRVSGGLPVVQAHVATGRLVEVKLSLATRHMGRYMHSSTHY
jgi:hypothetical protein